MKRWQITGWTGAALLMGVALAGCHKEEQAVVGVAQTAVTAEQKAQAASQAAAAERDRQRAQLESIPLPTKSLYVNVHEAGLWANPFLSVDAEKLTLRINLVDANPSAVGQGTLLRPEAARRQEIQLRPADLASAVLALPTGAWRYGRVIAIAESPQASPKDRAQIRRNVEAAIQQLTDLGVVVEEWPTK
jgi:hypothetical protein